MTLTFRKRRHAVKLPHYKVQSTQKLGTNPDLTAFLKELGLWENAQGKLQEVYYYTENEKKQQKHFYALGHQTETGSWQLFARHFTGTIGRSALTIINEGHNVLDIFLSYQEYLQAGILAGSAIIVNHLALLPQAIAKAKEYRSVNFSTRLQPYLKNK
jgi:hypothetical protein